MLNLLLEEAQKPDSGAADAVLGGLTKIGDIFTNLWNSIPQVVYFIASCCLMVIDFAQLLFRKIVGLDTYFIDDAPAINPTDPTQSDITRSGDMVLQLFKKVFFNNEYSIIKVTFISLIILSAILLVVTTIAAILRNEYSPDKEKKNSKSGIIKNFFKAIASFAIIPVAAYMGIWFGNAALYAIDSVTAPQNTSIVHVDSTISGQLHQDQATDSYVNYIFFDYRQPTKFTPLSAIATRTALYSANKVRKNQNFYEAVIQDLEGDASRHLGILNKFEDQENAQEKTAQCLDDLFMMNARLKTHQTLDVGYVHGEGFFSAPSTVEYFNRYDVGLVTYYYDLWHYMWPVTVVFILTGWKTVVNMAFGLLSRIIVVFSLLLVSPLICSIMPIDSGSALTSWRKQFVSNIISAYIIVFVFNLFQVIYPLVNTISLFGDKLPLAASPGLPGMFLDTYAIVRLPDLMFQFFFLIAGLQAITSLDSTIEKMLGRDDKSSLLDQGNKAFNEVAQDVAKTASVAMAAGRLGGGATVALAGLGYAGIRKMHDNHKEKQATKKRDAAGKRVNETNKSNKQIKQEATAAAKNSKAYQDAHAESVGRQIQDSFDDYKKAGGQLERDQWQGSALREGSAFQAHNDWNDLTKEQKDSYGRGGYGKFMGEQYNNSDAKEKGISYQQWLSTGKIARSEFERDANGKIKGKGKFEGKDHGTAYRQANERATKELDKKISESLNSGVAKDAITKIAVEKQQELASEKAAAREEYKRAETDLAYRRDVKQNTHRDGAIRLGTAIMTNGAGGMFRGAPRR